MQSVSHFPDLLHIRNDFPSAGRWCESYTLGGGKAVNTCTWLEEPPGLPFKVVFPQSCSRTAGRNALYWYQTEVYGHDTALTGCREPCAMCGT